MSQAFVGIVLRDPATGKVHTVTTGPLVTKLKDLFVLVEHGGRRDLA